MKNILTIDKTNLDEDSYCATSSKGKFYEAIESLKIISIYFKSLINALFRLERKK